MRVYLALLRKKDIHGICSYLRKYTKNSYRMKTEVLQRMYGMNIEEAYMNYNADIELDMITGYWWPMEDRKNRQKYVLHLIKKNLFN